MKKAITFLMTLLLLTSAVAMATDGYVTYEGGAEKFVFLPGSKESDTSLFGDFRNLLPGDEITQTIHVKNDSGNPVRIYMRAEAVSEEDREFLNQLHMTVQVKNKEIFDAQADEKDGLTKNTLLGTFKNKGSVDLNVTLSVPAELGSEYMGRSGIVPWTFFVEEIIESDTPQTGDWFVASAWAAATLFLMTSIVVLIVIHKKKNSANI